MRRLSNFIRFILLFLFVNCADLQVYAQYITTVFNYSAFGNFPVVTGVAADANSNLYFSDFTNSRIRKVLVGSTSSFTNLTSGGTFQPRALAYQNGFFYVLAANQVLKINISTSQIAILAGSISSGFSGDNGLAVNALFSQPSGIALDVNGNIYISDTGNNRIRKITIATGIITTVAGNGQLVAPSDNIVATSSSLSAPKGIAVDNAGNVYVADNGNHRIRKIISGSQMIVTIAGNGSNGPFGGDGGPGINASIGSPEGIACDASGNVYIADQLNNRIRYVNSSTGIITTFAGNGSEIDAPNQDDLLATQTGVSKPKGVALGPDGSLYILEVGYNVRKVDKRLGTTQTITFPAILPTCNSASAPIIAAQASSGLPIKWESSNWNVAIIVQNKVQIVGSGTTVITAKQGGNSIYLPAPPVSQTLERYPVPSASIASVSGSWGACEGTPLTLKANTDDPLNTYLWSTGQTSQSIDVNAAAIYSVVVRNSYGCSRSASSPLTGVYSAPKPIISASNNLCSDGYTKLTSSNTGASSYKWSNNITAQFITVTTAGSYSVTANYSSGCSRTSATYYVSSCPTPDPPTDPCNPPVSSIAGRNPCDEQLALEGEKELFIKEASIFPNKANERLVISIPVLAKNDLKVLMYSQTGQQVGSYVLAEETSQLLIDTRLLKNGMYLIHIQVPNSKGEFLNRKVMIEH